MSVTDLAEYLGVPVPTVYEWRGNGTGPVGYRIGKHLKFAVSDVRAWVDAQRDPTTTAGADRLVGVSVVMVASSEAGLMERAAVETPGLQGPHVDPIELASRVALLVQTGRRESTYKLATLMSLIDICVESGAQGDQVLDVRVEEIAHRLVGYYWPQVRPYMSYGRLRQSKQGTSIADRVAATKTTLLAAGLRTPEAAREASHPAYVRLISSLTMTVAQQPLTHLQTVASRSGLIADDFLFDASRFYKKMTRSELSQADPITLKPFVASGLSRTARLLKDVLRVRWIDDVVRLNKETLDDDDLAGFMFEAPRTSLQVLQRPLLELQSGRCPYCGLTIRDVQIDHVLPWSVVPINGIANLVAACSKCNGNKSDTVPVLDIVEAALARNYLEQVAHEVRLPVLHARTRAAAQGVFSTLPRGTPLWAGRDSYVAFAPHLSQP